MESHLDQADLDFRLTCVAWCCTFDGVVELEKGLVVSNLGVGSAAQLPSTGGRRDRCASVLPIQEHEVAKAIPSSVCRSGSWSCSLGLCLWTASRERIAVQSVDVSVPQMRRDIAEVTQLVLERIKGRVADQMDIPAPLVTSATADRRACASASVSGWERVQQPTSSGRERWRGSFGPRITRAMDGRATGDT